MKTAWSGRVALAGAVVVPIAICAALVPVRTRVDNTDVALVLVAVVVAFAVFAGRPAGGLAVVSAAAGFDFFHTRPFESLSITPRTDIETAAVLLVVGLIVGELSSRSTRHRVDADQFSADIARMHAVAELVSAGEGVDAVIVAVRNELQDLLFLRGCTFSTQFASRPRPRMERDGEVMMAGLRWGVSRMGLPGKEVDLIVNGRGRPRGRFILVPSPGVPVSWDRRVVAVALADQVGAALAASSDGLGVS
jgi:K+-sensing histidine kinase KdpD